MTLCLLVCLALALASPLAGQDDNEAGAWAADLELGHRFLKQGKRNRASAKFEAVLDGVEEELEEDKPTAFEQAAALEGLASIALETGDHAEAAANIAEARRRHARPVQDLIEARVLAGKGGFEKAIGLLRRLRGKLDARSPQGLEAAFRLGWLLQETGKKKDALRLFAAIEDLGKTKPLKDSGAILWYAKALIGLGTSERLYEASQLLIECTRQDPFLSRAYVARGDLLFDVYREARGRPSGESEYKRALRHCGDQELALVRLYETRRTNFLLDSSKTDAFLRRALALNKNSVLALRARASSMIDDRRFASARSLLEKAITVNPRDKRTLAEMAAACHLLYRREDEKAYRERALAVDPGYSRLDTVLGEHLVALYRFAAAVPVLRRAQQAAPNDVRALLALGRALIYAGDGEAAAKVLERTKELQKGFLNPWRENQLFLQKRLRERYEEVAVGNFVFRLHPSEKDVLLPYLKREYEAAWAKLGTKYGVLPNCKVHVEDFERFGDFSVRTIGFKGFGALGACFGCFITSVSPAAPELRSQFSWKVTAWHEFAHVLHLELSKARVPRWLTEGAAVYEEISLDRSFDRRMEREVHSALANDSVIQLEELNSVFRGPQILLGYYQGGLICRHIAKEWGFDKVVTIIKGYASDLSTEQVFEQALSLTPREYDMKFRRFLEDMVGSYALVAPVEEETMNRLLMRVAREPDDVVARVTLAQGFVQRGNGVDAGQQLAALKRLDPNNGDAFLIRAQLQRRRRKTKEARELLVKGFANGGDDFDSRMLYASILMAAGRKKSALEQFDAAIRCWPTCSEKGTGSPFLAKSALLKAMGRTDESAQALSRYLRINGKDYGAHVMLAEHYRKAGELHTELRHLEYARDIDPFDRKLHQRLGEIYGLRNKHEEAAFCYGICIAIRPEKDRAKRNAGGPNQGPAPPAKDEKLYQAEMRVRRAEALLKCGRVDEAEDDAKRALEEREKLDEDWVERAEAVLGK